MKREDLTQARLQQLLHYNPGTGLFTRLSESNKSRRIDLNGKLAGGPTSCGYWRIAVEGHRYRAHRLAWLYMTGCWPKEIDHINGDRLDNRFNNLRDATSRINKQNRRATFGEVGLLGVCRHGDRYRAKICDRGRSIHIGLFDKPEDAHAAYLERKAEIHEGYIHATV